MPDVMTVRKKIDEIAGELSMEPGITPQMSDLDSFTLVQLVLNLESEYDAALLEEMHAFTGKDFDDLADFVASTTGDSVGSAG